MFWGGKGFVFVHCPECNREMERIQEEAAEKAEASRIAQAKKEREQLVKSNLARCAVGSRFMGMVFDNYIPADEQADRVKRTCQKYAETFTERKASGDGLILIGNCGTGKNMLAACICQEVIRQGFFAFHTTVFKMIRRIKDSWRRDGGESEEQAISNFVTPDLLVIDEVGVQFGSDTEKLYLSEVINERYERMLPTILISNLTLEQIESVLGERIIDRFHEGKNAILRFTWGSYRRKQ